MGAHCCIDNVEPRRRLCRVGFCLMLYVLVACIVPLIVGELMRCINAYMFYMVVSFAASILVLVVRPARVTGSHLSEDAPTQFVPMSDSLQAPLVAAALDPRVDVETDVSHDPVVDPVEPLAERSEERRVGKECVGTGRSGWTQST